MNVVLAFLAIGAACFAVLGLLFGPDVLSISGAEGFLGGAAVGAILGTVFGGFILVRGGLW